MTCYPLDAWSVRETKNRLKAEGFKAPHILAYYISQREHLWTTPQDRAWGLQSFPIYVVQYACYIARHYGEPRRKNAGFTAELLAEAKRVVEVCEKVRIIRETYVKKHGVISLSASLTAGEKTAAMYEND